MKSLLDVLIRPVLTSFPPHDGIFQISLKFSQNMNYNAQKFHRRGIFKSSVANLPKICNNCFFLQKTGTVEKSVKISKIWQPMFAQK